MGPLSRCKGASSERGLASRIRDYAGWDVGRRLRQHGGDWDLEGVPGWPVESKRQGKATCGDIEGWWAHTVDQAQCAEAMPLRFFRRDRNEWRSAWPLAMQLAVQSIEQWTGYRWAAEGSVDAWAAAARELASTKGTS
jgi:hypothetical protein